MTSSLKALLLYKNGNTEKKHSKQCSPDAAVKITPVIDSNDRVINFIEIKDDITEKKAKDEQLQKNLKEKEMMLKEIHHRVKNNLQIVASLLNLQAASVNDSKLKSQLTISQNRVRSMTLIHQILYKSSDLTSINMEEYLYSLSGMLLATYNEVKNQINIRIDATDVYFNIETAVPFGLLVNELITNSMKHGFPGGRKGEIKISLSASKDNTYKLVYSDSGVGIPFTVVNGHVMNFGLYLLDTLVSQLDGKIEHIPSNGTTYNIDFPRSNYQTRFHIS